MRLTRFLEVHSRSVFAFGVLRTASEQNRLSFSTNCGLLSEVNFLMMTTMMMCIFLSLLR